MKAKLYKDNDTHYYVTVDGNIMASTDGHPLKAITNKLSLKNCQAIELGYDLDELADEYYKQFDNLPVIRYNAYTAGFQKALSILGDKKFTKNDILIAKYE